MPIMPPHWIPGSPEREQWVAEERRQDELASETSAQVIQQLRCLDHPRRIKVLRTAFAYFGLRWRRQRVREVA